MTSSQAPDSTSANSKCKIRYAVVGLSWFAQEAALPAFVHAENSELIALVSDDEVKLHMEVPGIDPQDLDVQVSAKAVAVRGERKSEVKSENKGMRRSEFRYGQFQRVIPLPAPIQNDKVQADFNNGVLSLTMPKSEDAKRRVVRVNLPGQNQQGQTPPSQPPTL